MRNKVRINHVVGYFKKINKMENKTFDEISWIQSYFEGQVNFGYEAVESVRIFTLIWNMFEAIACNKMVTIRAIEDFVSELHLRKPLKLDDFMFFLKFVSYRDILMIKTK